MRWSILNKLRDTEGKVAEEQIVKMLLENRGLKTETEVSEFLAPKNPADFTSKDLEIDEKELKKALIRIKQAIAADESIIVYGDYDADGICATAILWETLYGLSKNVLPYIPERVSEGYGLNKESIQKLKADKNKLSLIITVDHGITAADKIDYAKSLGIDVIVCDHHQINKEKPKCEAVIHTEKICAAAIAWYLSKRLQEAEKSDQSVKRSLDLVAIATIADLEPLISVNRSFAKYGLLALRKSKRPGLLAIFNEAKITQENIGTYEIGYIVSPRLNAMGRMEHALESLRLVCTANNKQALALAEKLGTKNRARQLLTEETTKHAIENSKLSAQSSKLIFISHKSYNQGIIGLVAGKLVEQYYRPAIVLSVGEVYSKASARSIAGFNIIEAIRAQSDLLVDAGGHPMAAGFTVETTKVAILKQRLLDFAEENIKEEILEKTVKIDLELPLSAISLGFWQEIEKMAPFGLGNPEPVFASTVVIKGFRTVGGEGKHLKFQLSDDKKLSFGAIGFNMAYLLEKLKIDQEVEVAYTITLNEWNGEKRLELKLKDLRWKN